MSLRFSTVRFTHHTSVPFRNEDGSKHPIFGYDIGSVSVEPNQSSPEVDSIEAIDQWVVIRWNGQAKCVPAAKVESADLLEPALDAEGQPVRRGPGRPRKGAAA